MSSGTLDTHKTFSDSNTTTHHDVMRATPVKRRRLLNLVDLRASGGMASSGFELGDPSTCIPLPQGIGGLSSSSSLGHGRRSRTPLTDLDSKFVTKSGLCGSFDIGDAGSVRGGSGLKVPPLMAASSSPMAGVSGSKGASRDDTLPRFPRLDQCAHFHYEYVELPPIQVCLVSEELKPLSQGGCAGEDSENRSLLVQVTSLGRSWVVRRTYENFRFLDKQLHRCCYDRKFSQLKELPPEDNLSGDERETAIEGCLRAYLQRFSAVAGSLITCGPVLGWLELDNRGHRLIVTDDSDINTPAVAAAYVTKRYTAQASDEISFEVGDMISVIDMPPPEESIWWRGKRGFQVGFFPCECVQVIGDKGPQAIHPQALTLPPARSSSTPPFGAPHHHAPLQASSSVSSAQEPLKPVLRKHGKLIAFFRPDMGEDGFRSFILSRPSRRRLKQSGILRERVFGCDLGEHLLNSGHEIPMVLKCCAEFIESHGTVDGIYRLSGITSNIQKLRNAFDEERVPELYGDESILQDIHCVSSVLKMYFRELPNPLLTYQLYDKFVTAVMQSEEVRLLHVRDVVQQLPPPHYRTLEYLIQHLSRIASHSSNTGMTPRNIAIVWAPNLLRSKDLEKGGVAALQDVGTQAVVTEFLVRYVDLIFNDKIPVFSPSTNGVEGTPKKLRPKSLAISTPAKLLSIDEAKNKALAAIKSDQKYIEVGGGPQSLPKTYHTVIDLPSRKGGSLKQKKSPLGWKTLFSKNRHQRKASTPNEISLNISDPAVTETDLSVHSAKRLRPVKSVESLVSTPASLHSNRNSQVGEGMSKQEEISATVIRERRASGSSEGSSIPSPRTHNRSVSHDSYFNLLERSGSNVSQSSDAVKEERESDTDLSPENSSKIFLDISELNLEFNTSEAEMKIFSEDETLKSTSVEDTLSRSTVDIEENFSIGSDVTKSKESVSSREKKSLKDKLKRRFTSPSSQRKDTSHNDSSEDSRSNSLKRASSVIKDKLVQALSPETSRKKAESHPPPLPHSSAIVTPKPYLKNPVKKEGTSSSMHTTTRLTESAPSPSDSSVEVGEARLLDQPKETNDIEGTLIDPVLMEKITRMRISPSISASEEASSASFAEATVSDNESFILGSSPNTLSNGADAFKEIVVSDMVPQSQRTTPSTPPITIMSDPHFQEELFKREAPRVPASEEESIQVNKQTLSKPLPMRDRPNSLLGLPSVADACGLGSALTSPETPQGDSTFLEIQYHPLSDTTEPSTPSDSHFMGTLESVVPMSHLPCLSNSLPRPSSPLSPDLSSSSAEDPIENGPLYENIELTSLTSNKFSSLNVISAKEDRNGSANVSPEVDTPTADGSELEYENIHYSTLEQSFYDDDDNARLGGSNSVTPSYENLSKEFSIREAPLNLDLTDVPITYENVTTPTIVIQPESLPDLCSEGEYEEYSFKEQPSYENVVFTNDRKEDNKDKRSENEIQDEVVYQQVKYLRKSIQEVNEILNETTEKKSTIPLLSTINSTPCQPEVETSTTTEEKMTDGVADMHHSEGSECLDSPVTPSSSSLVTEVLVLPSFSSPTESTTEDATSPDASESHISPIILTNNAISPCRETPGTDPSSPSSIASFIPTLSPPSPELTAVVTQANTRHLNTTLAPSPWPRSAPKLAQVWPPIPKPRNLPSLHASKMSSPPESPSVSSERVMDDTTPTPTDGVLLESSSSHASHNIVHIVQLPPPSDTDNVTVEVSTHGSGDTIPCTTEESADDSEHVVSERSSNAEDPQDSLSRLPEEDDTQKRERIEKYKEERRSFLREKYKSESFKGERDDMLLRLKQKATSPSRQDDDVENSSLEYPKMETEQTNSSCSTIISVSNVPENTNFLPVGDNEEVFSTTYSRFHSNSDSHSCTSLPPHNTTVTVTTASTLKISPEPVPVLNRSLSEDSKIVSDRNKENHSTSSTTSKAQLRSPSRPSSDSSFLSETKDDDVNVRERVAIWNRQDNATSGSVSQKRENKCVLPPAKATPPKLRKIQSQATPISTIPHSKPAKIAPVAKNDGISLPQGQNGDKTSQSIRVGRPQPYGHKVGRVNGSKSVELPISTSWPKGDKTAEITVKNEAVIKLSMSCKSVQTGAKKPVLVTQKSESDLREPVMLKTRSYSIGSGLGSPVSSTHGGSNTNQKRIKDMKALFERGDVSRQETANRPVVIRPTSRDGIGK